MELILQNILEFTDLRTSLIRLRVRGTIVMSGYGQKCNQATRRPSNDDF